MKAFRHRPVRATLAALGLALCAIGAAAAPSYRVTVLPLSNSDHRTCAIASLNDVGQVLMGCGSGGIGPLLVWSPATGLQDIVDPQNPDARFRVGGINNAGVVAGEDVISIRPFVWDPAGGFRYFGDGTPGYQVRGINDHNEVFGLQSPGFRPFVWSESTGIVLTPFVKGRTEDIHDRNNLGESAGSYSSIREPGGTKGNERAVKQAADGVTSGPFPVSLSARIYSDLDALNNVGQASGRFSFVDSSPDRYTRAFLWRADGSVRVLHDELPDPETYSYTEDLNDAGQGVGLYVVGRLFNYAPFYWDDSTTVVPLVDLIDPADPLFGKVNLTRNVSSDDGVTRINAGGQIAVSGVVEGKRKNLLLTPLP